MRISVLDAFSLEKGDCVRLLYPSSKTGEAEVRTGRVEEIRPDQGLFTICTSDGGYRSFKVAKIVGDIELLGTNRK